MKTYYFSSAKSISIYTILGLISVVMASCGSYKNSSYYDRDGIYGDSEAKGTENKSQNDSKESNKYKDYFSSLQKDNEPVEIFTDVDNYNTTSNTNQDYKNEGYESGYSGWGNNPNNVSVIVYDNNWAWSGWNSYLYGPSYGWGWNSWYGPSYGWGWNNWYGPGYYPYYGWGWNNYYNGYYNHHHVYNHGIRGASFRGDANRSNIGRRNSNYNIGRRNAPVNGTRNPNYNNQPRRNETSTPRNYTPREPSTPRIRTYTPRNENTTPRSNTPTRSESTSPRSYTPSSGSGQSSGGDYNGGRSSGGGRR